MDTHLSTGTPGDKEHIHNTLISIPDLEGLNEARHDLTVTSTTESKKKKTGALFIHFDITAHHSYVPTVQHHTLSHTESITIYNFVTVLIISPTSP